MAGFAIGILAALITTIFFIPLFIGIVYIILGFRSLFLGFREDSRVKKVSGTNTIFFSGLSIAATIFAWYWVMSKFLSWEM